MIKSTYPRKFISYLAIILASVVSGCSSTTPNDPGKDPEKEGEKEVATAITVSSFNIKTIRNIGVADIIFTIDKKNKIISGRLLDWRNTPQPDIFIVDYTTTAAKVYVGGVEQIGGVSSNSFKKEVTYTFEAESGEKEDYRVRFICPQINDEIPCLNVLANSAINSRDIYTKARLDMIGTSQMDRGLWSRTDPEVEIRLRGNSTSGLPKKPYRLKFPEKYSPLGLNHASAKSWVLLANDTDKTLLRNAIAFAWSRILFDFTDPRHDPVATLFTPATLHVNVYIDNHYVGLYTMTDQIERDKDRINLKSLKAADVGDATKIKGGYLLEVDIHANPSSEPYYFPSSRGTKITPKYPEDDDHAAEQYAWIRDYLATAEESLYTSRYADWSKYWDTATAVDYFIVNEFSGNPDGFTSTYLYKQRDSEKFFFGPVWDFDKAFNNDNRTRDPLNNLMKDVGFFAMESGYPANSWHKRMWESQTFRTAVKERWDSKKDELLLAAMEILDKEPARMRYSIDANFTKWLISQQALGDAMPGFGSYDEAVLSLRKYIQSRYQYLDSTFR